MNPLASTTPQVERSAEEFARGDSFWQQSAEVWFPDASTAKIDVPAKGSGKLKESALIPTGVFVVEHRYEGAVLSVQVGSFEARLLEKRSSDSHYLVVSVPDEEVPTTERSYIAVGAVFYWIVGYISIPQYRKRSILSFQTSRPLTEMQITRNLQLLQAAFGED